MDHLAVAQALVEQKFSDGEAAFLIGSIMRGELSPTSDLDIVLLSRSATAPYQEGMKAFRWSSLQTQENMARSKTVARLA
jgi:UTP:GlnB (protein PII) uridylyltransferase